MKLEYMAPCKFCGQMVAITASEQLDDLTQREWATEKCHCDMAEEERVARDAIERLHQIGGAGSVENGFDYAFPGETMEMLENAVRWCAAHKARKVEIIVPWGDVVKLTAEPKRVKVSRTHKKQVSL